MTQPPHLASADGRPAGDPNLGILLRDPYLAFSAELLVRLHNAGYTDLRPAHLVVFQHIDPSGSRITDLAAKAHMTKPSMAYLVEHLENAGYLQRSGDPTDGRARIVALTERGWQQINDALDIIATMEQELADALEPSRLMTLRCLLTQLGEQIAGAWVDG